MTSELVSPYTGHMLMELVEVDLEIDDPEEAESLVATGTLREMEKALKESLENASEEYEEYGYSWPTYRIQPAK